MRQVEVHRTVDQTPADSVEQCKQSMKKSCKLGETHYDASRPILVRMPVTHSPGSLRVGICGQNHAAACKSLKSVAIREDHRTNCRCLSAFSIFPIFTTHVDVVPRCAMTDLMVM